MFDNLTERLQATFNKLARKGRLSESDVDAGLRDVRLALLEADVNYRVVKEFIASVRERAVGSEVTKSLSPAQQMIKIVNEELIRLLGQPARLKLAGQAPHVVMLVGLQGSGKTTMAAKLALFLRRDGHKPLLVAADPYRPAAITQLEVLGRQLGVPVYSDDVRVKPADVSVRAVKQASDGANSVVILDTAGRLQIDEAMMAELEEIKQLANPAEILLVADAMTGQEAVRVAEGFHSRLGLTGLILTKVDGDARGGAALSIRSVTGVPIKFLGVGEKTDALELFYPDRLASRILGMGDLLTLIERAEGAFDQEQARKMEQKLREASFDLEDFREQLREIKKMGPLSQLLEMIPGFGQLSRQLPADLTEKQMKCVEAIISSMTREERRNPQLLNGSRKRRIAAGSGTTVQEVNQLLNQFRDMQRMMKQFTGGRGRGIAPLFH
jgi:signal recognition particle subunit SRP54